MCIHVIDLQKADMAVAGLLADEFDDFRLMTSRAMLRTSLTLMTSRRRRHNMTLRDVVDDVSLTPGIVAHSRAERLLRRSRQPVGRRLWRRISGKAERSRSRDRKLRRSRRSSSLSRVMTLDAGVSRLLDAAADDDDDFVLIVESTDAAYVSSRRPGCSLTVAEQTTPVAEYRFVLAAATSNSSSTSWQRRLLQRLDAALAALHRAAVIKRLYYKWWTSTDCLAHFTDPNIWTVSVDHDAADFDETLDDERIFLQSPVSAAHAQSPVSSTTCDRPVSTGVNDDELNRDEMLVSECNEENRASQRPVRRPVDVNVTTTADSRDTAADNDRRQRHTQSVVASSTSTVTSSRKPTTTTVTTTTTAKLLRRSNHKRDDYAGDARHSSNVDGGLRNYDDFQVTASTEDTDEEDRFHHVFETHGALTGHAEDDYDGMSLDDYNETNGEGQASEQEMAVKEHWHSGGGPATQSTSSTTTRASAVNRQLQGLLVAASPIMVLWSVHQ